MVKIPKRRGKAVAMGELVKVTEFRPFGDGKRGRVGVQVKVKGKNAWFNMYGTENSIQDKLQPIDIGDPVTIEYNEREYSVNDTTRVARDIVSISLNKTKKLPAEDVQAFMPDVKDVWFNIENDLRDMENIVKHIREVMAIAKGGDKAK